jgi:hypothetical protein
LALSACLALALALLGASSDSKESTLEAIVRGRAFKWEMRSQPPFRREAARMGAVRAFRAGWSGVGTSDQRALCAFRAGELLRAGGLDEGALAEFASGVALRSSPWSHRSALAGGKMLADLGRRADALRILKLTSKEGVPSRFAEPAALMRGVLLAEMGRRDSAAELWREVAIDGLTPLVRLEAFELWGQQLLEDGDIEGAAGVLHLCRERLSAVSCEATERGEELRARLTCSRLATAIRGEVLLRRGSADQGE